MAPKDEKCLTADRPEDIPLWRGYLSAWDVCRKYGIRRDRGFMLVFRTRGLVSLDSGESVKWAVKPGSELRVQEAIFRAWFNEVVERLR